MNVILSFQVASFEFIIYVLRQGPSSIHSCLCPGFNCHKPFIKSLFSSLSLMAPLPDIPTILPYVILFPLTAGLTFRYFSSARRNSPPGPQPVPLIGNVLQIPAEHPEECFAEWSAKYGLCRLFLYIVGSNWKLSNQGTSYD